MIMARSIILLGIILSTACAGPNTPGPANTPRPTDRPQPTATNKPAPANEPAHDMYAGLTGNGEVPFIVLHPSGEKLGVTQDISSSTMTGVVWISSEGEAIVIYVDTNGMPTSAVIGEDFIQYSNYTNSTVDVTIIYQDGNREMFQAELDTELLNKITAFTTPLYSPVAFASSSSLLQPQQDVASAMLKFGLFTIGVAACLGTIPASATPPLQAVLPKLVDACVGSLLTAITTAGNILKLDVGRLEDLSESWDKYGCMKPDPLACAGLEVEKMEKQKEEADRKSANIPAAPPNAGRASSATLYLDKNYFCRYAPSTSAPDVNAFEKGSRFPIINRTDTGWWEVEINLSWSRHKSCWIAGGIPEGDYGSVPIVIVEVPVDPGESESCSSGSDTGLVQVYELDNESLSYFYDYSCSEVVGYGWSGPFEIGGQKVWKLNDGEYYYIYDAQASCACPGMLP